MCNVLEYIRSVLEDLNRALELLNYVLENNFLHGKSFFPTRLAQWVVCMRYMAYFPVKHFLNFMC